MISRQFVINKSSHYIISAHSGLLKIPKVQGAVIQEVALMVCAAGIQVEMKPQRETRSEN